MLIARQTHRVVGPSAVALGRGTRKSSFQVATLAGFAAAFLLATFAPALRADIQLPAKGRTKGERQVQKAPQPPLPVATTARVEVGGRVEIVLRATGAIGRTVDFILRSTPAHGDFEGEPRRLDRDSIAVTYVHRARDGGGHDEFTFAAQTLGTPVSAAGTIDIEIVDAPQPPPPTAAGPDVAATPAELDFGAVETGRLTGATLTLENRGGTVARGRLDPPRPWDVEGNAAFELAHGERQTFRIVFRPTGEGSFAETLRVDPDSFGRTAGCVVQLIGTGLRGQAHGVPTPEPSLAPEPGPTPSASVVPTPGPLLTPPPVVADSDVHALPDANEPVPVVTNEARVGLVDARAVSSSIVALSWRPPVPLPRSYRIERRSFASDDNAPGGVRIDWLPYPRAEYRVHADEVTADLRGFAPGELVTVRVVSVDAAGRLSEPSPLVSVFTNPGATWWRPTPLKGLFLLLAILLGLIMRRRWQTQRFQRELNARHELENDSSFKYAPKG